MIRCYNLVCIDKCMRHPGVPQVILLLIRFDKEVSRFFAEKCIKIFN